jgi:lipoyl(octanoyl) transferase
MQLTVCNIGRTRYADAWTLQREIFDRRVQREVNDVLLFTEHEHVYTLGKGGDENHLLASDDELREQGVDVFRIDRGGDITYHGPGQVVGYPILDLRSYGTDIHRYLRNLEETIIRGLADFGILGVREEGMTGVWVKGEKIAAIGVKVSRWATMHGFALNVNTDLAMFHRIIPCGIFHKGVTSMQVLLGESVRLERVHESLARHFAEVFGCVPVVVSPLTFRERLGLGHAQEDPVHTH